MDDSVDPIRDLETIQVRWRATGKEVCVCVCVCLE